MKNYLIILIFFISQLGFGSIISSNFSILPDILIAILLFFLSLISRKKILNLKLVILIIFMILGFCINSIVTNTYFILYFGVIFRILLAFGIIHNLNYNVKLISHYFIKSLWIVCFLAIINYFLIYIFPNFFIPFEAKNGIKSNTFLFLFNFNSTINLFGFEVFRNQGMFWEPGVLQIPMIFLTYHLILEKKNYLISFLPISVLLTTFSTTGFIGLSLIIFVHLKNNFFNFDSLQKLTLLFFATITFGLSIFIVNHKLNDERDNISTAARTFDLLMGISIVREYPFAGLGIQEEKYLNETYKKNIAFGDDRIVEDRGNTNSILSYFIKLGIPMTLFILVLFYNQNLFPYQKYFFSLLFISLTSEPIVFSIIWFLFMLSSVIKFNLTNVNN